MKQVCRRPCLLFVLLKIRPLAQSETRLPTGPSFPFQSHNPVATPGRYGYITLSSQQPQHSQTGRAPGRRPEDGTDVFHFDLRVHDNTSTDPGVSYGAQYSTVKTRSPWTKPSNHQAEHNQRWSGAAQAWKHPEISCEALRRMAG